MPPIPDVSQGATCRNGSAGPPPRGSRSPAWVLVRLVRSNSNQTRPCSSVPSDRPGSAAAAARGPRSRRSPAGQRLRFCIRAVIVNLDAQALIGQDGVEFNLLVLTAAAVADRIGDKLADEEPNVECDRLVALQLLLRHSPERPPMWTLRLRSIHHKRKRPKHRRAGCLLCKPSKLNANKTADRMRARRDWRRDWNENSH